MLGIDFTWLIVSFGLVQEADRNLILYAYVTVDLPSKYTVYHRKGINHLFGLCVILQSQDADNKLLDILLLQKKKLQIVNELRVTGGTSECL